jgi:hypothetical protein
MHFLTIVKPGPAPPPVDLVRSAEEWIDGKLSDGTFECCYAFVEGGGFSVGEADSLEGLMDDLLDYPLRRSSSSTCARWWESTTRSSGTSRWPSGWQRKWADAVSRSPRPRAAVSGPFTPP